MFKIIPQNKNCVYGSLLFKDHIKNRVIKAQIEKWYDLLLYNPLVLTEHLVYV